jgi:hypothetical protein
MAKPFPKLKGPIGAAALQTPGVNKFTLRIPLAATANANPVLTGVKIPAKTVVSSVYVDMLSSASSADPRLDVGISTSTQGFISGASVTTLGLRRATATSGQITYGALMLDVNGVAPCPGEYIANSEVEVTYSTRAAATQLKGTILIECLSLSA